MRFKKLSNFKMPIGKFRGQTLLDIAELDHDYLEWFAENTDHSPTRTTVRQFLNEYSLADYDITEVEIDFEPTTEKFFVIFNPDHPQPPRRSYNTRKEAEVAAKAMAEQHPEARFYVLQAVSVACIERLPVTVKGLK